MLFFMVCFMTCKLLDKGGYIFLLMISYSKKNIEKVSYFTRENSLKALCAKNNLRMDEWCEK